MGSLAWWHWLLIIAAFVILFGAKKLPDAARGVGRSLRILKSEVSAMHEEDKKPGVPSETDASASVPTPTAQLSPAPIPVPTTEPGTILNGTPAEQRRVS